MTAPLFLLAFFGLSTLGMLGVFGAAATLTVGLYILRLRRRQVEVPFLDLWERFLRERKASALRSRLQRLLSLLLSLLVLLALVFALGDPRRDSDSEAGRAVVLIVDVSASMGEKEGSGTRLDRAREILKSEIESLAQADRVLLVEMGARARPLSAWTRSPRELEEALERARVLDVRADLQGALRLGRDALRGREKAEMVVVSDGALPSIASASLGKLPPLSFKSTVSQVPERASNLAITSFSARRYVLTQDRFEVLVEVQSLGDEGAEFELTLSSANEQGLDGGVIDVQRVALGPGERFKKSYDDLTAARQGLIARVERVDGRAELLASDNVARTLLSPRKPVRVLVVGPANNFLEAALLVDESLEVSRIEAEAYPPASEFDVVVFDDVFPRRIQSTGAALYLGAPEPGSGQYPVDRLEPLESFGFDSWKKESTVFRQLDPYNVQVLSGFELRAEEEDQVVAQSEDAPILVRGTRPEGDFLALGFSPRDSDFVLRSVWPLFVQNSIEALFPRSRGEAAFGVQTGTLWRPPLAGVGSGVVEITGPLGSEDAIRQKASVEDGRLSFFGERAGFYSVSTPGGERRLASSLFGTEEGRLLPALKLSFSEGKPVAELRKRAPRSERPIWVWLVLGVLAVSFLEWWTYHRRWTV